MIEAIELTSTRRSRGAGGGPVEAVSFDVYPGQVTALLGAPGAGKSTVLRLMVELEPGGGRTLFGGRPYRALRPAVREVGLALNPDAVHPGRTVQAHLQLYAAGGGVPKPRIAEVLEVAGLSTQATVRCGRLDPGQRQRLAIAAALLGDPAALILDEPHALDDHGMSWFHALIRAYAAQGRTVLVAATDPDTLCGTADHVIVLRRDENDGISRVIASRSAAEVFEERRATVVQVRSPQAARLAAALEAEGARLAPAGPGALQVRGLDRARIGEVAHVAGVCLHELCEVVNDEDVFGLRPVPRQKELLPGLKRTDAGWRAGVRVVAEIEEAEVIETAAGASAEEVSAGGNGAVPAEAFAQVSQGASCAQSDARASVAGPRESAAGVQAGQVASGAEAGVSMVPAAGRETAASVGAQASGEQQLGRVGSAAEVSNSTTAPAPAVSIGAQGPAHQRAVQTGSVVGARETASVAGSWRTQGSVAGSRWSAVKGSQVRPSSVTRVQPSATTTQSSESAASPPPALGVNARSAQAQDQQGTVANRPSKPAIIRTIAVAPISELSAPTSAHSPQAPRPTRRRTGAFGVRWGRGKSQHPVAPLPTKPDVTPDVVLLPSAPKPTPAPVLTQPAVPFTVAPDARPPAAKQDSDPDGMTPWRAVAARASHQNQQQDPVAEAAPAEQETSA